MHLAYGSALLNKKEKVMFVSHGENSGFSPVTSEELTKVNGGIDPVLLFLVSIAVTSLAASCVQPTNPDELNRNAQFSGDGKGRQIHSFEHQELKSYAG
jgi:hypothetical protein